jgi:hypothetical protein
VAELGTAFLNASSFAPAEAFDIEAPGRYRISLHSPESDLWVVLVSVPYGTVLARTAPWAAGIVGALALMTGCLIRLRRVLPLPATTLAHLASQRS